MIWKISNALGDPALYTNAIANKFLPFVVDWEAMSDKDKYEMDDFWASFMHQTKLRSYSYMLTIGIVASEYVNLRAIWSKKGGERCYELGHGIFNDDHPVLKACGFTNWGQWCFSEGKGIFNADHPMLKAAGITNWGQWCYLLRKGLFDDANAQVVQEGNILGGEMSRDNQKGIFNKTNAKLIEAGVSNYGSYNKIKGVGATAVNQIKSDTSRAKLIVRLKSVSVDKYILFNFETTMN